MEQPRSQLKKVGNYSVIDRRLAANPQVYLLSVRSGRLKQGRSLATEWMIGFRHVPSRGGD